MRFDITGNELQNLTPVLRWQNTTSPAHELASVSLDELPEGIGLASIQCDPAYRNQITLQPVWVGNLLFWRLTGYGDEASGEPLLLPVVANVWPTQSQELPVEFYWGIDTGFDETIHLLLPVLDLIMEE